MGKTSFLSGCIFNTPKHSNCNKYSTLVSQHNDFFIPQHLSQNSKSILAASLSQNTWKKHNCALKCWNEFKTSKHLGDFTSINSESVQKFIVYCFERKNLKSKTIRSYISSISLFLKLREKDYSFCSSFMVSSLLRGIENLEFYRNVHKGTRKVMTLPLLKLIGHQIANAKWTNDSKQVFWTALTVAFFGSLRLGEILSYNELNFNKFETLLWEDVNFRSDGSLLLKIKISKNRKIHGECVDLFPFEDERCCPVKALKKLFLMRNQVDRTGKPVFMFQNGKLLTPGIVNTTLPNLIAPHLGGQAASEYRGHSLRAGIPSAIASRPEIANDQKIKMWGRWSSESYLLYTRLKLSQKRELWNSICKAL